MINANTDNSYILVLYYSRHGHVKMLAEQIALGGRGRWLRGAIKNCARHIHGVRSN